MVQWADDAAAGDVGPIDHARLVEIAEHVDVYEFMFDQGITDGLPVIPPTRERVDRMLAATTRDPLEMIARVPPNYAPGTVEKIAINAVMAGAKPEYFQLILAVIEATHGPQFSMHGATATTAGLSPAVIVNGPIRERIGMNSGLNALGQGNRANSTIGRALRLVVRNVGGAKPGEVEQAIQGGGHKWTLSFAEREEYSPWEPLHVEHGYEPDDNVVSIVPVVGGPRVCIDQTSRDARALTGSIAMALQQITDPKMRVGPTMLVVSPEHADVYRASGWSKDDIRECIMECTALPLRERLSSEDAGCGYTEYLLGRDGYTEADLDQPFSKFSTKDLIVIVVAGSNAGKWTSIYPGIFTDFSIPRYAPAAARVGS